jgi:hypothetical protein
MAKLQMVEANLLVGHQVRSGSCFVGHSRSLFIICLLHLMLRPFVGTSCDYRLQVLVYS